MAPTLPWLKTSSELTVAIVGDLMLDEYLEGKVHRISPEAPVPVHLVESLEQRAGGAANVALNVKKLGGDVALFGRVGRDKAGEDLIALLNASNIDIKQSLSTSTQPTTRKMRVTSNRHQMIRIDWEMSEAIESGIADDLLKKMADKSFASILISDYGKGLLTKDFLKKLVELGRNKSIPVLIDPKGTDFSKYEGASLITPNRSEACMALGLGPSDEIAPALLAARLMEIHKIDAILITLGPEGMYYLSRKGEKFHVPAKAKEVFDVSGAGDTVAAVMALALASRCPIETAIELANKAGGIVVGKWGTHPLTAEELSSPTEDESQFEVQKLKGRKKILSVNQLKEAIKAVQKRGKKVVFTNGCFDLIHAGHIDYLEASKALGDFLVCGVNSDASVKRLKGPTRPITPCDQRMRVLAALECIDFVTSFEEDDPLQLITALGPDILTKGADWPKDKVIGGKFVESRGGKVVSLDLIDGLSTSNIVNKILKD